MKEVIYSAHAPKAIGPYSQAIKVGEAVYFSGQIPLDPNTMMLVSGGFSAEVKQVFLNLKAVANAAGGNLNDMVKLTIYLTDLTHFPVFNDIMTTFFEQPYPARTTIQVSALPKGAQVEVEGVMHVV